MKDKDNFLSQLITESNMDMKEINNLIVLIEKTEPLLIKYNLKIEVEAIN